MVNLYCTVSLNITLWIIPAGVEKFQWWKHPIKGISPAEFIPIFEKKRLHNEDRLFYMGRKLQKNSGMDGYWSGAGSDGC